MKSLELSKEFEIYKLMHKQSILIARIAQYYRDLAYKGVSIPEFMCEDPLEMARKEVLQLQANDMNKFNALYEQAWTEIAEVMP